MKGVAMFLLLLVAMAPFMALPSEAITCGQVTASLAPCLPYLTSGGSPPANCCAGVKTLAGSLRTRPDRQTACNCLKSAAASNTKIRPDAASSLPGKCGVSLNVPISPTTNCNNIP